MMWKEMERPAKKADYRYKHLRLLATPPEQRIADVPIQQRKLPVRIGDVVKISMRRNARETRQLAFTNDVSGWGDVRVLEVEWPCPHCGHTHRFLIPESWLDEGKAEFVELAKEGAGSSLEKLESPLEEGKE